jgi:hypothetical protein
MNTAFGLLIVRVAHRDGADDDRPHVSAGVRSIESENGKT